jgi:sulfite reductase alpha subunit-like flavoprotein
LGTALLIEIADNTLYFGCRSESKDQHYAEEWQKLADAGKLIYRTAFSREEGSKYRYVQNRMREDKARLWQLIHDKNAWIYISGYVISKGEYFHRNSMLIYLLLLSSSNKMPKDVRLTIQSIAEEPGGMSSVQAADYVSELYNSGRVIEECWS